tara:strand:+ start:826 stop:1578 length:753 start_codon:yes stop_codon:yes gene_type:complete
LNNKILDIRNISKSFGGVVATNNISFNVKEREIHALIGPNGAGKTTLINIISGEIQTDTGDIYFDNKNITNLDVPSRSRLGLGRSFQITNIFLNFSLIENVIIAIQSKQNVAYDLWNFSFVEEYFIKLANNTLEMVGLKNKKNYLASDISHGDKRLLDLALSIAVTPKLLLLDEPMAGVGKKDGEKIIEIISTMRLENKCSILLIEHDMDIVFKLADRITVLTNGDILASGNSKEIKNNKLVRKVYLGED